VRAAKDSGVKHFIWSTLPDVQNPFPDERLKFAVDVTTNLGPCSSGATLSNVCLSATRIDTNLFLRWPTSPYRVFWTKDLEHPAWAPVDATPFRSNADLVVNIIISNANRSFYRLKP